MGKLRYLPPFYFLFFLLFCFSSFLASAQSPGGVSANLRVWYKADAGVTGSPNVSQWDDQSGNGFDAPQGTGSAQPIINSNVINFNPAITFDGGSDYLPISTLNYASSGALSQVAVFVVFKTDFSSGGFNNNWAFLDFDRSEYFNVYILGTGEMGLSYNGSSIQDIQGTSSTHNDDITHIGAAIYDNSVVNDTRIRVDGFEEITSDVEALSQAIGTGTTRFGIVGDGSEASSFNGGRNNIFYDGEIAEIIYYENQSLTANDIQRIESYLAVKYGKTLNQSVAQNYLSSSSTVIYPATTTHSAYINDIAGIGRDDNSGLDQQRSSSINSDAIITMDKGAAFPNDEDFILWGNDNGATQFTTSNPHPSFNTILQRIWRAAVTGTPGNVTVEIDLSGLKNTGNASDYALLIDNADADFTSGATATTASSLVGNVLTFNNISLTNGDFFTLGFNTNSPGGALQNLQLWLRADRNVFEDVAGTDPAEAGDNIEVWQDISINDHLLIQDFGGNPTFELKNTRNTIDFSGGSNYLRGNSVITGTTARSMFVVLRPNGPLAAGSSNNAAFALAPNASAGAGYGLFIELPSATDDTGMGLRVSGNKLMDFTTPTTLPTLISTQSGTNADVTSTDFFTNGSPLTAVVSQSANTLNTSGLGVIAGGFSSGGDNDPDSQFDFDGDVFEVVVFDIEVSSSVREQVNTYLALKYGITKLSTDNGSTPTLDERDYIASDGSTVLWDFSADQTYSNDITGIGRDDVSDLELQSNITSNDQAIVSMDKGGSFSSDLDFLLWGNDDNTLSTTSTGANPPMFPQRVTRIWKVKLTGTPGTVSVSFQLGDGIRNSGNAGDYALLIDGTDTDFSDITPHTTGATIVGDVLTFTNVNFSDGDFFTLAAPVTNAPGGVSNNLHLWLRADQGVTGVTSASAWDDQSLNGFTATQSTGSDEPDILTEAINFNTALNFDGASKFMDISGGIFGSSSYSDVNAYAVTVTNTIQNSGVIQENTTSGQFNTSIPFGNSDVVFDGGDANQLSNPWGGSVGTPFFWTFNASTLSTPNGDNMEILRNGLQIASSASYSSWTANNSDFFIGNNPSLEFFDGEIGDIIVYTGPLTSNEQRKIHSYLATKYGITINQAPAKNYLASTGAVIYASTTTQSGYLNDIAGIGRDEASDLDQPQSKSVNTDAIVTIDKGGAFSNDLDFLFWGNDNGVIEATTTGAHPSFDQRLVRTWKVDVTGTPGNVSVSFEFVDGIFNSGNAADYALLIDGSDTDFSDATAHTTGASIGGNAISFTGVAFNDGDFFTLAVPNSPGPGGVSLNMALWYKANAGVEEASGDAAEDGDAIEFWRDQSPFSNDAIQSDIGERPALDASVNNINFNPVLDFSGSDHMPISNLFYDLSTNTLSDISMYAIIRTSKTGEGIIVSYDRSSFYRFTIENDDIQLSTNVGTNIDDFNGNQDVNDGIVHLVGSDFSASINEKNLFVDGAIDATLANAHSPPGTQLGSASQVPRFGFVGTGSEATTFDGAASPSAFFEGQLAEVVFYERVQNTTQRSQIESYLAIKYGITLDQSAPQDYIASDGNSIYGATSTQSGYLNDIAGIGRDDNSVLEQQQSRSINGDALVTIDKGGSFSNDLDFMIWGNDDGAQTTTTTGAHPSFDERLVRTWKVDITGTPGMVDVEIDIPAGEFNSGDPSEYALLIDNTDTDFSDATAQVAASIVGNTVRFTGVTFNDEDIFTLGFPSRPVPGGVQGLTLWYKANTGVTGSPNVSDWADQSGNGFDAPQATSTAQPTIVQNAMNFNPAIQFDGTSDYLPVSGLNYTNSGEISQIYVFSVFRTSFIGSVFDDNWAFLDFDRSEYFDFYIQGTGELGFSYTSTAGLRDNSGATTNLNDNTPHISAGIYDNTIVNDTKLRIDGLEDLNSDVESPGIDIGSGTPRFGIVGDGSEANIFDGPRNNIFYEGDIAEVIFYQDQTLNSTDIQRIESYLGIKYGVTLDQSTPQDYLASDASTVYDASANSGFLSDIAGIGRDDDSELSQPKSISSNSDAIVTIALTDQGGSLATPDNFDNDLEFLIWGNDNGAIDSDGVTDFDGSSGVEGRVARVWKVEETGTVGQVTIQFDASSIPGVNGVPGDNDLNFVRMLVDTDGTFAAGATIINSSSFNNTTDLIEFQHDFTVGTGFFFTLATIDEANAPLPIELLFFRATPEDRTVRLEWATASEFNNDFFTVERSTNLEQWDGITEIKGAGNSDEILHYDHLDENPLPGISYYRLKQTDFDGTFSLSQVNRVDIPYLINVFPNPSSEQSWKIISGIDTEKLKITVWDINGNRFITKFARKVSESSEGQFIYKFEFKTPTLLPGVYFLSFQDNLIQTSKIVIE